MSNRTERVAELVNEYGQMVYATAYRILGSTDDAEDALQEVFLKVLGKWNHRLDPEAVQDWAAYLRVTASRCAIDLLRKNRKRRQRNVELSENIQDLYSEDPRRAAMQHQKAALLRQALGRLPKREARVFALRYFEDFSYERIADHLGIKSGLVGVLLHQARGRLQKILEPLMAKDASLGRSSLFNPEETERENRHVAG